MRLPSNLTLPKNWKPNQYNNGIIRDDTHTELKISYTSGNKWVCWVAGDFWAGIYESDGTDKYFATVNEAIAATEKLYVELLQKEIDLVTKTLGVEL